TFGGIVFRRIGSRSPHMDFRIMPPKGLGDAVADTAGAAHHEHRLAAEIQFIHCILSRQNANPVEMRKSETPQLIQPSARWNRFSVLACSRSPVSCGARPAQARA